MSTRTQQPPTVRTGGPPSGAGTAPVADGTGRAGRAALGILAAVLVTGAWFLPVWQATLHAPQYPGGLTMRAYGHQVTGDVAEIDTLNHYVGMRAFDPADVPEMQLWPLALGLALVAVAVGLVWRTSWPGRLARVYLWVTPPAVLAVIQFRLHQYGHDLEPLAALRLEPFTPWVVGPTKVWNFTTWSWPGLGLVSLLLAAAVVSFGPRWLHRRRSRPGHLAAALALVPLLLAAAPAGDGHGTGHGSDQGAGHGVGAIAVPEEGPAVVEHPHAGDLAALLAGIAPGGRLVLPPGTYHGPLVIDRPVILEGRDLPLIVGDGTGSVLTVRAPGTVIRGIAVRGSGPGPTGNPAAIRIEADDVRVEQVVVEESYTGIAVAGAARTTLVDNVIRGRASVALGDDAHAVTHDAAPAATPAASGDDHAAHGAAHAGTSTAAQDRGDGIWLHDTEATLIRGNLVEDARDGIYMMFAERTLLDANHVRRSRYAVHSMWARHLVLAENRLEGNLSGAVLMYGEDVLALRNTIRDNRSTSTGFGLLLKDVVAVQADRNILADNRVGVHLDGPAGAGTETETVFAANTIARNQVGVAAYSSARAAFRANSFADNLVQVMPRGGSLDGVFWMDRGVGNYWSSYRGYAGIEPGRGAVPHVEGGAVDRLLLRNPELVAIADSPAMRLLRSIEERWGARTPVAVDHVPLTAPVSPRIPAATVAPAPTVGIAVAVALLVPSALVLWRPRRRAVLPRRSPRVVPT